MFAEQAATSYSKHDSLRANGLQHILACKALHPISQKMLVAVFAAMTRAVLQVGRCALSKRARYITPKPVQSLQPSHIKANFTTCGHAFLPAGLSRMQAHVP